MADLEPPSKPHRGWSWRKSAAVAALILVLLGGLLYGVVGIVAAAVLTQPRRVPSAPWNPASFGLIYRDVEFPARGDGLPISAWFIPNSASRKAIILVHGKDQNRTAEFFGHYPDFAAALQKRGFNILAFDLRGHGASGAARYTWGAKEQWDVQGAASWLSQQGFESGSVGVHGVSMGAASSILAAAGEPLLAAVVADSSYAAIYPVVELNWTQVSGLPRWFLPGTALVCRLLYNQDFAQLRPVAAISAIAPRPILLVHGAADRMVPVSHARELHAAAPWAELWELPGVDHAGSYPSDPSVYVARVATFFSRSLR
jgi:uncharacterized protein